MIGQKSLAGNSRECKNIVRGKIKTSFIKTRELIPFSGKNLRGICEKIVEDPASGVAENPGT